MTNNRVYDGIEVCRKGCRILMKGKSPSQRDSLQVFFLSYRATV